ncbi:MAG: D-glycero-beta-D-manno-heptose 1,7-bisphosphate 7-phosphatase [Pseudomonadales bacterium]|jgi:D-glycero-D-manno-heptose 1,7-bisphosphate phosphatase|nr:D-glycero-beta-D-manno-heptose 1,7-bisphosphate 7-phosphatase [Pseudomonadales bacterium]MDP6471430.1 D-glycero-beta-D-manno-heptose 1,7-bisphosphate 7-phosphatase [Pseudomonadales bacterium]MDP6828599.1 D-glycero-beta-D-manno-heptose 1,7-bisphosphate 7-phosphatase [Pseudomonadales bacterium]MDP6973218.1 D-glycero-beta-D-manno-heptose 1,7-bisphosphate 7-phosphatase [Pseudomonadales bacterium]|tara:strand:- start:776 stop:1324 length:549 start_codon:yes stop_codon:yes gene_type:complete
MLSARKFKLVLLDRDGVINHDSADYIRNASEWSPIPGALQAIVALQEAGIVVAVCTNQSGVGRGLLSASSLHEIHDTLQRCIEELGGQRVSVYYCPHRPDAGCGCRKPEPGMLLDALHDFGCDAREACFVGDSARDLQAAKRAGCEGILVRTGNGGATEKTVSNTIVFDNLATFANHQRSII